MSNNLPKIGVIMGSQSDWSVMKYTSITLNELNIIHEIKIISAHRTPDRMYKYAKNAKKNGLHVIIAGAGGSAHLPGMTASMTTLPVFGVPITTKVLNGQDSLFSIVQMPKGIPVGTLAIGKAGAINAALLAISIISLYNNNIEKKLINYRKLLTENTSSTPIA